MASEEDLIRLHHMLEAAQAAVSYAAGHGRGDLEADGMLAHALTRCLEIIGEAATQVTSSLRAKHPQIPWRDMTSMRNRLIHAYFDVNLNILWRTVTEDLPPLIANIERILAQEDAD
jgi:uncharacterized protein with HEPN domain